MSPMHWKNAQVDGFDDYLSRIEEAAGHGVFTMPTLDRAWREQQAAQQRRVRGLPRRALEAVTVGWKDVFDVAGCPTRAGTRFFRDTPAATDHPLVAKLSGMGTICVGKMTLTELAFSALGENDVLPSPRNPWSTSERVCGGSSSGAAAAVARSLVDVAVGTDCGGSVRLPAAWCGVVGFKPTAMRIATAGVVPFSPTLDAIGQLGATVADVTALYTALSGHVLEPAAAGTPIQLVRLRLPDRLCPDRAIAATYEQALDTLAAAGLAARETHWDPVGRAHRLRRHFGTSISAIEGASLWRDAVRAAGDRASPRLRRWATTAAQRPQPSRRALDQARHEFIRWFAEALPRPGVLVLPSSPLEPPLLRALEDDQAYDHLYARSHSLLWPFNELDAPAISIPCGRTAHGLPVGLQIVAPRGRDHDVLRAAAVVEAALGTPPVLPSPEASMP